MVGCRAPPPPPPKLWFGEGDVADEEEAEEEEAAREEVGEGEAEGILDEIVAPEGET